MPDDESGQRGRARKSSGEGVGAPAMEEGREEEDGGVESRGGSRKGNGDPYDDVSREINGDDADMLG